MDQSPQEVSTRQARATLADVVNAAVSGRITYITQRGRRVAAVVPLPVAEEAEGRQTTAGVITA